MPTPKKVTRYIDSAISVVEVTGTKLVNQALLRKILLTR